MAISTPGGGSEWIAIQALPVGQKIRLRDGALAEVHENPRDGMWLIVRYLATAGGPVEGERIELVGADDVARVADDDVTA